jgi:aromatic-L-amino-acid/L-tryptophan decarboxylase
MAALRESPVDINKDEFRKIGYQLIETLSEFLETIHEKPVTSGETPEQI